VLIASGWGDALTALVPFVLLIVFWAFLRERIRKDNPQQQVLEKLDEIREELVRLRKSIESRP
jgi:preprotein translocase subunit YajC